MRLHNLEEEEVRKSQRTRTQRRSFGKDSRSERIRYKGGRSEEERFKRVRKIRARREGNEPHIHER